MPRINFSDLGRAYKSTSTPSTSRATSCTRLRWWNTSVTLKTPSTIAIAQNERANLSSSSFQPRWGAGSASSLEPRSSPSLSLFAFCRALSEDAHEKETPCNPPLTLMMSKKNLNNVVLALRFNTIECSHACRKVQVDMKDTASLL